MKCMSCGVDIPPTFKNSINLNICASCGGPIMSDLAIELLDELKGALEKMPNDPEGLAGWLLSNYEMRKIGTGEPVQFFRQQMPQQMPYYQQRMPQGKEDQIRNNLKVAPNKLAQFYGKKNLHDIAQQINSDEPLEADYGDMPMGEGPIPIHPALRKAGGFHPNPPPPPPRPRHPGQYYQQDPYGGYDPYGGGGYDPYGGNSGYGREPVEEEVDPAYMQAAISAMEAPVSREQIRRMASAPMEEDMSGANQAAQIQRMDMLRKSQELMEAGQIGLIKRRND